MSTTYYTVSIRDAGVRKTGLTPSWVFFKKLFDKTDVTPQPTIDEIGEGVYRFSYDPTVNGEVAGQIDGGSSIPSEGDRYIDIVLTRDTNGNIALNSTQAFNNTGQTANLPANTVQLDGQNVTAAAGVTFPSTVASPTNITGGTIGSVTVGTNNDKTGYSLDLTQTVPATDVTNKTTQTVGDCLSVARANGAGKWVFSGTTWTEYGPDNETIRTFTLDQATNPTQRS